MYWRDTSGFEDWYRLDEVTGQVRYETRLWGIIRVGKNLWYYCSFNQYTTRNYKLSQGLDDTVRSISTPYYTVGN